MPNIISVHSFRGGTGKSSTAANIAAVLAMEGQNVGVIDTDIQSPGIYVLFGVNQKSITHSLNDYLYGRCGIEETVIDVTAGLDAEAAGKVWLAPASMKVGEITRVLREGWDAEVLTDGYAALIAHLKLDTLVIDTHPGLNTDTLVSISVSDVLALVLRPDEQDYQGTAVTAEVARKLGVPRMVLVVNKVPSFFDSAEVRKAVEKEYNIPVAAILPHSDEMMALRSSGIFVTKYPDTPTTEEYRRLAHTLNGS